MRPEAEIVIDGTRLTDSEAMVVRVAVGAFISELSDGSLGFVIDGVPITSRYQSDAAYVHTLLVKSEPGLMCIPTRWRKHPVSLKTGIRPRSKSRATKDQW